MNPSVSDSIFDHIFHDLVASVDDIVFRLDAEGRWSYVSDAWDRLLGRSGLERIGLAAVRDFHADDRREVLRQWAEVRRGSDGTRRIQVRVRTGSGSWLWMQGALRGKWYADGRFRGAVGCLSDISAIKSAEDDLVAARKAAESANKAKSEFLSTMSHELRTPLNAVIGLSESLLEMGPPFDPERTKRYVTIIHQSGRQLLAMINDILDLARIEAGRIQVNASDFDLGQLLAGVLDAAQHEVRGKALRAELPRPAAPVMLRADERLLRVVAQNLLANAVKFTPKGGSISLRIEATADGAAFSVRDTGIGIAPEQQAELFQPFRQLDASLAREYGGTGLGLALVQRIVRLHGGEIGVESAPGAGSTFTVRLPASCLAPAAPAGRPVRERSVLIVDDDPRQQVLLGDFFRRRGFAVRGVERAQDALEALAAGVPGLLVADVNMPGMSGFALIARVRAMPACAGLPILAVTALAEPEEGARCVAAGADAHLPKPVSLVALWQKTTALTGLSA